MMLRSRTLVRRTGLVALCIAVCCEGAFAAKPTKPAPRPAAKQAKPAPKPPEKEDIGSFDVDGARVVFTDVRPSYAKALVTVAGEARRIYSRKYGFDMPDSVSLMIRKRKDQKPSLWTDGESTMTLTINSGVGLLPPLLSGTYNIYGMCHELGHMAMYRKVEHVGLPSGVAEGWAHYAGSVVVDEVFRKYGEQLYPVPYNYAAVEGTARLKEQASQPARDDVMKASQAFHAAHERYGADKVMGAMKTALDSRPAGKDLMPRFVDELVKATGDKGARKLFPDDVVIAKLKWEVKDREITEKTFGGLRSAEEDGGITLSYDDGKSDGMLSDCGSGFAVVFKAPAGSWAVDQVRVFGSRFGTPEPPKEDFSVYICDKDFGVIREIAKPYGTFERGDAKWYTISFDPVSVPEVFYVALYFRANTYKGVYMNKDKDVERSHSYFALPYTFIGDVDEKFDWMVRAHLKRVRRESESPRARERGKDLAEHASGLSDSPLSDSQLRRRHRIEHGLQSEILQPHRERLSR